MVPFDHAHVLVVPRHTDGRGYGDEYPMYAMGRIIAMICATVGILIVAVPIEVIGRYFGQHFQRHT